MLGPVSVVLVIGAIFVSVDLAAFHAPRPHSLPIAAAHATQSVATALNRAVPGGFAVERYTDVGAARQTVGHRRAYGAIAATHSTQMLLYAGANGPAVTTC